jgi:hypothetical protein
MSDYNAAKNDPGYHELRYSGISDSNVAREKLGRELTDAELWAIWGQQAGRQPGSDGTMRLARAARFAWQRWTRGWDDSETWSLDATISCFILPRLKRFKEISVGTPGIMDPKTWQNHLDDMIFAFERHTAAWEVELDESKQQRVRRGLALFAKYFPYLWW